MKIKHISILLFVLLMSIFSLKAQDENRMKKFITDEDNSYVKLMFVGDIPINQRVVESAYRNETHTYDFQPIFHYIRPYLNLGDIVAGSLETTIGTPPYGKFPQYRSPKDIATSLKYTGFNLLFTANGKSIYQDKDTWTTQQEILNNVKIKTTGSFIDSEDRFKNNPLIIEKKGIKIAFLNYMDGIANASNVTPMINAFDTALVKKDINLAKERGAEYIVVYMYWGEEFELRANTRQQIIAKKLTDAGANLVVGTHPHTVQDMDVETYQDANGKREALTVYSMGDFLSTANSTKVNSSAIFEIIVSKNNATKEIKVEDYGYIPTYCYSYNYNGKLTWSIVPVRQVELENIEIQMMSGTEREQMISAAENIRHKYSPYMQEIEYKLTDEIINDVAESLTVTKKPMNERENVSLEKINLLHQSYGFGRVLDTDKKIDPSALVYRVQFMATRREKDIDIRFYRHLKDYEVLNEDGYYKYVIGYENDVDAINRMCDEVRTLGHPNAFVVIYKNGKRISNN